MEKYLITGFSGFVSKHFLEYLESSDKQVVVYGIDINYPEFQLNNFRKVICHFNKIDLLDKGKVDNIIFQFRPDFILHLASFSSVAFSWKNPVASFANNTNIFLNLLEQIRALNLKCRILSVGSSEEYGNVSKADVPLLESHKLKPVSPYAVARVSQEMLSKVYVDGFGLDIIITRSFNHIGPGQRDIFVVSSFASQLVNIKKYNLPAELTTGNLNIIRDFLDVRDVVKAYYLLLHKGEKGEIYNVCSGVGISLETVVKIMTDRLNINVKIKTDKSLIRPSDNSIIVGNNEKLKNACGWVTQYSLKDSIGDVIDYWNNIL